MNDAKGPLVQQFERDKREGVQLVKAIHAQKQEHVGTVPVDATHLSPTDKSQSLLPDFYARGLARGPVAYAYWREKIEQFGLKGMAQYHKEMTRLLDSHWAAPIEHGTPAQLRQVQLLRAQGLHASGDGAWPEGGPPLPQAGGVQS